MTSHIEISSSEVANDSAACTRLQQCDPDKHLPERFGASTMAGSRTLHAVMAPGLSMRVKMTTHSRSCTRIVLTDEYQFDRLGVVSIVEVLA